MYPRKKRVSFSDQVERIPESFQKGVDTNSDAFVYHCKEVFYFSTELSQSL